MNLGEIVKEVLESKKYEGIDQALTERIASQMLGRYSKKKDVIKSVKNELHIINESFLLADCHKNARKLLADADEDLLSDISLSKRVMALHTSTSERLSQVDEMYTYIGEYVTENSSLIDIGCGFNPFSLPFLNSRPRSYTAYDINNETITLLNDYFLLAHKELYHAELLDAVSQTPVDQADTALLLKLLPLLQQQQKGRAFTLLDELSCRTVVVSFPIKSMSGKDRGMEKFYSSFFEDGLANTFIIVDRKAFTNELFYIIQRK